jgi:hypothetical protein
MKKPKTIQKTFLALLLSLFCISQTCHSQDDAKFRLNVGLQTNLTWKNGEAADYLSGQAVGTDTLWGLDAEYSPETGIGFGIDVSGEYNLMPYMFFGAGLTLKSQSVRDQFTIWYDPAVGGISRQSLEILDQMIYFSPRIMVGGRWEFISFSFGGEMNLYVNARTKKMFQSENTSGQIEDAVTTVRTTTWDQPIYKDSEAVGGVRNYTDFSGMNHGLNSSFFNPFAELRINMPKGKNSPFVAIRYSLTGTPYRRSNNPEYSLVSSYNPGTLREINLTSRISSLSITAGWTF